MNLETAHPETVDLGGLNLEGLDLGILGPALVAGLLVLATHVPLGQQVLRRGIIFIDLAVAQIAGLGVIAAYSLGWEAGGWQTQLAAITTALAGALSLYHVERRWPEIQEAIIGTSFVLAASAGILLLAANPHGGEHLRELLAGQILWVGREALLLTGAVYAGVLALWFGLGTRRASAWFYVLFAVAVTASVQLVGVYLVFASLIIPALATRTSRAPLVTGYLLGATAYALGLAASALFDLPSGALIVWVLALLGIIVGRPWSKRSAS